MGQSVGIPCVPTGTDRWDGSMNYGTVCQSEGIPRVPIGTVGWDGQVG